MRKSKHTPGPWAVEPPSGRQARTTIWKWHPKRAFGENVWIATIYCGEVSDAEAEANARLIAAAPELLEALRAYDDAMTSCWGAPEYLPDGNPDAARCWHMARAAIAKATRRRPMSKPDTSREAVEMLAHEHTSVEFMRGMISPRHVYTAATLRALLDERDAARAQLTDVLAENDALRFSVNNVRAIIEAAYQAGAEAMRRAAQDACQAAFQPAPAMDATAVNAVRAGVVLCVDTIRALPLPKMETKPND